MVLAATRLIPMRKNKGKSIEACLHNHTRYIQNPDKTEQGELVSSYQCNPLTVDEEFLLTKRLYEQTTGRSQKSDVIAYQVRQSFKPGEVTPEEANRIGYEFAERFSKGKHAFIVATHTDRAHIHNHIIYNSTALDGTRKFKNFWLSTFAVQRLSDLICLEHQLSTIEYKPYRERQKRIVYPPKESNRDRLCGIIDTILAEKPGDYETFLQKLEQQDYEVKRGKHTAVKGKGQKRFIRFRTLGTDYGEDEIKAVLAASSALLAACTDIAGKIPLWFLTVVVTIFCSGFISLDYPKVMQLLLLPIPQKLRPGLARLKNFAATTLLRLVRAYLLLLLITFGELCLGLWLLGVGPFAAVAAVIALLDLLPVIGTGSVLVPWAVLVLLGGESGLGWGLIVLYLVITVARNFLEPRIVGSSIGLPPLLSLVCVYAGLRLFGVLGAVLMPCAALTVLFFLKSNRASPPAEKPE